MNIVQGYMYETTIYCAVIRSHCAECKLLMHETFSGRVQCLVSRYISLLQSVAERSGF